MFGKSEEKKMRYNIKVDDEDYFVTFKTTVRRGLLLKFYNKMQRKAPTRQSFEEIEQDGWQITPKDNVLYEKILGTLSKRLRKQIKEIEADVKKEHIWFRILSHTLESVEFDKEGDHYKVTIEVSGICV